MFQSLKKEAAANAGLPGSGIDLFLSYDKKFVDAWKKMVDAKAQSIRKLMKWAMQEDCKVLQAMFTRIAGLESLWVTLQRQCISQYESQRSNFKDVIEGEKTIDLKKQEVKNLENKVNKLIQKIDGKKTTDKRKAVLDQLMMDQDRAASEFYIQLENHDVFKMSKFQKIINSRTESNRKNFSNCLKLCDSQKEIVDIFLNGNLSNLDPSSVSQDKIHLSACIVTSVSQAIGLGSNQQISSADNDYQARQEWFEEIGTEEGNDVYGSLVGDLDAVFASAIYNPIPEDDSNQSGGSTPASDRNFDRFVSHATLGKTTSLQSNLTNSTSDEGNYDYVCPEHEYSEVYNNSDEDTHQEVPHPKPLSLTRDDHPDMDYENTAQLELRMPVRKSESCYMNVTERGPPEAKPRPSPNIPEQKSERRLPVAHLKKVFEASDKQDKK